jgi:putative addiction module CopG family antidote
MDVTLTPKTEAVVRQKVADGRFASPDDVIEAAVLLLDERDRLDYLRGLLLEAEQQVVEGKTVEWSPELHRQWRHEAEERIRQGLSPDPDVWP